MQPQLVAPLETAGFISMFISVGTILSSLFRSRLLKSYRTDNVTFVSVLMTAIALLAFFIAPSVPWLIIWAIPLGLGAVAIDTGLNDYVALNYEAHHMSWLHSFWGIGATLGPIIMSQFIMESNAWRSGYFSIAMIQFALAVILFLTLPLWKKVNNQDSSQLSNAVEAEATSAQVVNPLRIRGVVFALRSEERR